MIAAGSLRIGMTFELHGQVYQVVDFQHVNTGRGAAYVRVKLKNVMTGSIVEETFNPQDKMPKASIERRDMQYLYKDGDLYYFMDTETFEQTALNASQVEEALKLVKENEIVKILSYKEKVFGIEPPTFVVLEVIETEPGFRGDTATNINKPATVETGAVVKVPIFVNQGDKIRIDTRTGEYMERA